MLNFVVVVDSHPMQANITTIAAKVRRGVRLGMDDGKFLVAMDDLQALGRLAGQMKRQQRADRLIIRRTLVATYQEIDGHNRTYHDPGRVGAYLTPVAALITGQVLLSPAITAIHIIPGTETGQPFHYFTDMLASLKARYPALAIRAFSADEILQWHWVYQMPIATILHRLMVAGLDVLAGGRALALNDGVRQAYQPDAPTAEQWLAIHRAAHQMGLKSQASLVYGAGETHSERLEHLILLRELQDETQGFTAFTPLPFQQQAPRHAPHENMGALTMMAISRLLLDNFPAIVCQRAAFAGEISQLASSYGADIVEEFIPAEGGGR